MRGELMAPNTLQVSPIWPLQQGCTCLIREMGRSESAPALDAEKRSRKVNVHVAIGVDITNRCSCPLKGRPEQWIQPGNSIQCCVDAAGQLNSMLGPFK